MSQNELLDCTRFKLHFTISCHSTRSCSNRHGHTTHNCRNVPPKQRGSASKTQRNIIDASKYDEAASSRYPDVEWKWTQSKETRETIHRSKKTQEQEALRPLYSSFERPTPRDCWVPSVTTLHWVRKNYFYSSVQEDSELEALRPFCTIHSRDLKRLLDPFGYNITVENWVRKVTCSIAFVVLYSSVQEDSKLKTFRSLYTSFERQ